MLGATVALILLLLPFFYQLFVAGVGQDTGAFVPASVVPLSLLENTWTLENPLKQVCTAVSLSSLGSSSSVSGEGVPAREAVFVLGLGCLVYTHVPQDSLQSFSELHRENADRNYEKNMLFKVSYLAKLHSQSSTGEIIGVDGSSARAGGCPNSTEFYLVLEGIFSHSVNISADSTDWKQYEYVFAISPAAANSSPIAVEESNTRKFIFLNGYLIANPGATMDGLSHCASHLNVAVNNISISYINQPGRYPVAKRPPALKNETDRRKVDNACGLLGLADAVILNRIQINQSSSGVYDSGKKDVDSTSTVHQNLTNLSSVPFKDRDKPSETRKSTPHVPQILCGVFTTAKNHNLNVKAMMETWASKCSFFISFSTENDPEYNAFDLPHLGDESYYNMWQKSRSIWKYIHHNYMDDFDYFMLGGDDMYVIMENLHEFLLSNKVIHTEAGLYLGRRLVLPFDQIPYNAGGPGYLLDRVALKVLVANLDRPHCHPDLGDSKEDVFLSFCLQSSIEKIFPFNTTADSLGRERFHVFAPGFHLRYRKIPNPTIRTDWYSLFDPEVKEGVECCSESSISFHTISSELMYMIDDFLYRCPKSVKDEYYQRHGELFYDRYIYYDMLTAVLRS